MDHQQSVPQKQNQLSPSFIFSSKRETTYCALFFFFFFLSFLLVASLFYNYTINPFPTHNLSLSFHDLLSRLFSPSPRRPCDYSYGRWVWDEDYPLRKYAENCSFLDPGFRCHRNGRRDSDYVKWRWQPQGCNLPRFDAKDFLERSRNGRIVFAGDSIGRNQWESLLCMLSQGVSNQSLIYEVNGSPITKHKGFLSMRFQDYNLTVEYYRVPFLVVIDRPPANASEKVRSAIRVDRLHWFSSKWAGAHVLVFSAGHWWNQDKTAKMGLFFQEKETLNMTMDAMEGFQRSLQTWKSWVLQNLNPESSHIFFRSYSPTHYRDGAWNAGGHCDKNMAPESNYTNLDAEPLNNQFISLVIKQMESEKRKVQLVNITYLTEFRRDGHPSKHREPGTPPNAPQDCSHWCLPGVPDTWNELLYAYLLLNGFNTRSK